MAMRRVAAWAQGRGQSLHNLIRRTARRAAMTSLLLAVVFTGTLAQFAAAGLGVGPVALAKGPQQPSRTPNTLARFDATGDAWGNTHGKPAPANAPAPKGVGNGWAPDKAPPAAGKPTTKPLAVPLTTADLAVAGGAATGATSALRWAKSDDGMLEVGLPAHAIDVSAATATGAATTRGAQTTGSYTLRFEQTQGAYQGPTREVARFALMVLDGTGGPLSGVQLRAPIQLRLHYGAHELDTLNTASLRLVWVDTGDAVKHVAAASVPVSVDAKSRTLSASVATLNPGPMVVGGSTGDAAPAATVHLTNQGNQGDLSFTYPLALPPAAGGLLPPLQLVYTSAGPNGRSDNTAPAPWVGDGFDLSLGSISYDPNLQMYFLNGVGGFSTPLLCCMTDAYGNTWFAPHHDAQLRVRVQDNSQTPSSSGKCFYVYTPDGLFYQLGCNPSAGSLRYRYNSGTKLYYEWDVDKVQRVNGSSQGYLQQYTATYWNDMANDPGNGLSYVRDAALDEVDYNYVGGSPQARVLFNVHWPQAKMTLPAGQAATSYGTNYNCRATPSPNPTTLRCDDPISVSGWVAPPLTVSTLTLDNVSIQVNNGAPGSSNWQTVRRYDFSYLPDDPYNDCWLFGVQATCAGEHALTSIQQVPYQGGQPQTSLQPLTFGYTWNSKNEYHDTTHTDSSGNPFDYQTWWRYLVSYKDLQAGASASIQYVEGYGNTHGVTTGSVTDPTTCNTANACTGANAWPDDRQWPRHLAASITDTGVTPNLTTSYTYRLNTPCGTTCTQDTWIPPSSWNACGDAGLPPANPNQACLGGAYTNFYNGEFTGFSQVTTTRPDGSTGVAQYWAGGGWGTNDWGTSNMNRGRPTMEDTYQGAPGGAPLEEVQHTYTDGNNYCPVTSGSNNLYRYPYEFCEWMELRRDTYLGGNGANVPHLTQTWSYVNNPADQNRFLVQLDTATTTGNDLLSDSFTNYGTTQPTFTTKYTYAWHDGAVDHTNYYLGALPVQVLAYDNLGNGWACARTSYDGQGYLTGQQAGITNGLATRADRYSDCGNSGNGYTLGGTVVTTGAGYDGYGNPLVATDADALAGNSAHTGCAAPATPLVVYPAGAASYTACTTYDANNQAYATTTKNALNQQGSATWDFVQGIQTSATDANGVTTTLGAPVYALAGPSQNQYVVIYGQAAAPGEIYPNTTSPWSTRTFSYSFCAADKSATRPCTETDTVSQLDGTNLAVGRTFYDRDGRAVESRTTSPNAGYDLVTFTKYDNQNDKVTTTQACQVAALTTSNGGTASPSTPGYVAPAQLGDNTFGDAAYLDPATTCTSTTGTTSYADALGRTIATDDAMGTGVDVPGNPPTPGTGCAVGSKHHTTCAFYDVVAASSVSGLPTTDTEPYLRTTAIDADLHQGASYADALGRVAYTQRFTGASQAPLGSGIASYAVQSALYDGAGAARVTKDAGGNATTLTYDRLGRLTTATDPDSGTWTYTYDANGNPTQQADARGAAGTVYAAYDGLNRPQWKSANSNGSSPFATWSYDSTTSGNAGVGRLTSETFASGPSQGVTGSYSYTYDTRGRATSTSMTLAGPGAPQATYTLGATYDDVNRPATTALPAAGDLPAETLSYAYNNAQGGILASLTSSLTAPTATLFTAPTYTNQGLLAGWASGANAQSPAKSVGLALAYDGDLRLSSSTFSYTQAGGTGPTTLAQSQPTYDAAGNVVALATTLAGTTGGGNAGGSETQAFCYDDLDRLTWAGTQGAGPCGRAGSESIAGAGYTATYAYDNLDRITNATVVDASNNPLPNVAQGAYAYNTGNAAGHLHALAGVANNAYYSAAYDAAGHMTCRAVLRPDCAAAPIAGGQSLTYDPLGRMVAWQGDPAHWPGSAAYAYDGEGCRVYMQGTTSDSSGTYSDTWVYLLGVEEVDTQAYGAANPYAAAKRTYPLPGGASAQRDGTGLHYQATDALGTPILTDDLNTGAVLGIQLRAPYGQPRLAASAASNGGMHTTRGFTGQREDAQGSGAGVGASGLDFFNARYYDPAVGRFAAADTVRGADSLGDAYAYVAGRVEVATDPSGHIPCVQEQATCGSAVQQAVDVVRNLYFATQLARLGPLGLAGGLLAGSVYLLANMHDDHSAPGYHPFCVGGACAVAAPTAGPQPTAQPRTGPSVWAGGGVDAWWDDGGGATPTTRTVAPPPPPPCPPCNSGGGGTAPVVQPTSVEGTLPAWVGHGENGALCRVSGLGLLYDACVSWYGLGGGGGNSRAARAGNRFHYDQLNGSTGQYGPSQLQNLYPNTIFRFARRREPGPDVTVVGGADPWDQAVYPGSPWPVGIPYADFKPDTATGTRTFINDIYAGKFPVDTVPIWYDQSTLTITLIGW